MPIPQEHAQVGRLALRKEGQNWVAYYAVAGTLEGAIFLGSIRMGAILGNEARKQEFMALMREVVADLLEETTGQRPVWGGPEQAPESERSGHG